MSDGLEDVVAADTVLSDVDGKAGHLIIRGYTLDELAGRTTYEDLVHLLFEGFFDDFRRMWARPWARRGPRCSPRFQRSIPDSWTARRSKPCAR